MESSTETRAERFARWTAAAGPVVDRFPSDCQAAALGLYVTPADSSKPAAERVYHVHHAGMPGSGSHAVLYSDTRSGVVAWLQGYAAALKYADIENKGWPDAADRYDDDSGCVSDRSCCE